MATDATGTPTSLGIPKFNVDNDAPSGLGTNAMMDEIDALLQERVLKPAGVITGDVPVWNGTTWVRPSGSPDASKFLRGDGEWAPAGAALIFDSLLSAPAAAIDTGANAIPATYKSLLIHALLRSDAAGTIFGEFVINGDASVAYDWNGVQVTGTSASGNSSSGNTSAGFGQASGASAVADVFTSVVIQIPSYAGTASQKIYTFHTWGMPDGTNMITIAGGGRWRNTAAINQLKFLISSGNLIAGSRVSVWGL